MTPADEARQAAKPLYSGVRKTEAGHWQPFVRVEGGPDVTGQATRTRWEAAQLAQTLHGIVAAQWRASR